MSKYHDCAVPGCNRQVPASKLMCRDHWFAVPASLRSGINATWRAGEIGAYRQNVSEAIRVLTAGDDAEAEATDAATLVARDEAAAEAVDA